MDNKFYVSLEAARLLKEKGYNEVCYCVMDDDGDIFKAEYEMNQDLPRWQWSCPTKAEAIDWLESKGIRVEVTTVPRGKWRWSLYSYAEMYDSLRDYYTDYETRLEAEEAAIIEACKFLENGD